MEKLASQKGKRIFWLGMHKLLVTTELKRLRMLGYEVFNPPYLSSVVDQSAIYDWTVPLDSTLPSEAIAILSKTNFFYAKIPAAAAEILNHYFETAIVTIHPGWLKNFLQVYHGRVIYRVYGQIYQLSQYLADYRVLDLITEREDFWFCPHHEKTLLIEDPWLSRLKTRIIPYCLSDDIIARKDHWTLKNTQHNVPNSHNIGLMCPRILDNHYYNQYYKLIKRYFSSEQFKVFGIQIIPVTDPQVIGTLKRKDFLAHFTKLRGFIYHYTEPAVCYLPPIEFMILGGPVIFLKGSLLSKYFSNLSAPGEALDMSELAKLAKRLKKDDTFINEVIASQKKVRMLYHPNYVWPIFDRSMTEMLNTDQIVPATNLLYRSHVVKNSHKVNPGTEKSILIPFHQFGPNIEQDQELNYYSVEGIARVVSLMVKVLTQHNTIIITSHRQDFGKVHGFFTQNLVDYTKLKILIVENGHSHLLKKINGKAKSILTKDPFLQAIIKKIRLFVKGSRVQSILFGLIFYFRWLHHKISATSYIQTINQDKTISHTLIPHYYLFPETHAITKPMLLYLPDYLPHFYKGSLAMGDHWTWRYIGKKLAKKAKVIITNSEFTRNYLPNSALEVKKEKIISFPLAYLNQIQKTANNSIKAIKNLPEVFIFYPTRNRPSKRLDDFSTIVNIINTCLKTNGATKRVYGVLTTNFTPTFANKYLISLPTLPDVALTQVYQLASALVFTSENEGNFPTQINEALYLNTPIIASNIQQITDELGEVANALQLVTVGDCSKFADAVLYTISNREKVLTNQQKAREYVIEHFSQHKFSTNLLAVFSKEFHTMNKEMHIDAL